MWDPLNIAFIVIAVLLLVFMIFNTRKRQKEAREQLSQVQPGVRVMTNSGLFGVVSSVNDEENEVVLETAPGVLMTFHRQAIGRIVTPANTSVAISEVGENSADSAKPEFGERLESAVADNASETETDIVAALGLDSAADGDAPSKSNSKKTNSTKNNEN